MFKITPNTPPKVCFAKPDLSDVTGDSAGPATIWNPTYGFITQSTSSASYGDNFPTTGANELYFELSIGGAASPLDWSTVQSSDGKIIATPSDVTATSVRYTLTGPFATDDEQISHSPGPLGLPILPATFELVGKTGGTTVVRYGFIIKKWYIVHGKDWVQDEHVEWCDLVGYTLASVADLTNASGFTMNYNHDLIPGATPAYPYGHASRNIGAGLLAEWGPAAFGLNALDYYWKRNYYWTRNREESGWMFAVSSWSGHVIRIYRFAFSRAVHHPIDLRA